MMKVCVLGSGSEGNATLVYSDSAALLVDAGFSAKELERRLKLVGFEPGDIDAIVVSHEHADHIRGVRVFAKKFSASVYLTDGTLKNSNGLAKGRGIKKFAIDSERPFHVGDIEVEPFAIPHDAAEPVAFTLRHGGGTAVVLIDIGSVTVRAVEKVRKANLAVIESNHDSEMLLAGPYPWHLKQRISGKQGHLSNSECADLLEHAGSNGLGMVIFAHLSKVNNNADLVRVSADCLLNGHEVDYEIASQDEPGRIHEVQR